MSRKFYTQTLLSILALILAVSVTLPMYGCAENKNTETSTDTDRADTSGDTLPETVGDTETVAEIVTEAPTDTPTEAPTELPTEADTEPETRAPMTDGMMIYYEDFESYGDKDSHDDTVSALGWKIQTVDDDWAYSDWTAQLSVKDGRLQIHNYWEDAQAEDYVKGTDGYILMLDANYMKEVEAYGDYTLQYDVTYTGAGNYKRYIAILTEYDGDVYHSFHFRIGGYANNQTHLGNTWYTQDLKDDGNNLSAATTANTATETTIANKLLGITNDITDASAIDNFKDVTVTIRIQHSKDSYDVYMKTAQNSDFILVSKSSPDSAGYAEWEETEERGGGVALKPGGTINGWVDNIAIWTGHGDMPADTTVSYQPAQ